MRNSNSLDKFSNYAIGAVFTPESWAHFAIEQFGLLEKWLEGASVFDPTMGQGALLKGLITYALQHGYTIDQLPLDRLFGLELNTGYLRTFLTDMQSQHGICFNENQLFNQDIFEINFKNRFDIVFTNPPWMTFNDLPADYKDTVKPLYLKYDLVSNTQALLLGGSRIDIAALVLHKVLQKDLKKNGQVVAFMPLSLLLNDGASQGFRKYNVNGTSFSFQAVYDLDQTQAFENVGTRYGLANIQRDKKQAFPVPYYLLQTQAWVKHLAKPQFKPDNPWSISSSEALAATSEFKPVVLSRTAIPRQGINTGGANHLFIFDSCEDYDRENYLLSNKKIQDCILPKSFVFPLLTSKQFTEESAPASRWVLLPYLPNGKPVQLSTTEHPYLSTYLQSHASELQSRKGQMLGAFLQRGQWWALLGVGDYCFAPFKVVWEAYGKSEFKPSVFDGTWQVNQSLQAYIPARNLAEAESICKLLRESQLEEYLLAHRMEGSMNWAQPGRVKQFIRFEEEILQLF